MNNQIRQFAHQTLKDGLAKLTEGQQDIFKRMYSFDNRNRSLNDIVDLMPDDKLDWAMQQVLATLTKNKKLKEETNASSIP